jgi:hypothetical protein
MKLKKMIKKLRKLEKKYGGDLQVRINADHSQSLVLVSWVGTEHILTEEIDEFMVDDYSPDEDANVESSYYTRIVEIQGY